MSAVFTFLFFFAPIFCVSATNNTNTTVPDFAYHLLSPPIQFFNSSFPDQNLKDFVLAPYKDTFLLLGGRTFQNKLSPTIWTFNGTTDAWGKLNLTLSLYGHCVAQDEMNQILYIFGGRDANKKPNGLIIYNVSSNNMTTVKAPEAGRELFASCTFHNNTLYVFGGCDDKVCSDKLIKYNIKEGVWYNNISKGKYSPMARSGATMTLFSLPSTENKKQTNYFILMVGGLTSDKDVGVAIFFVGNDTWIPLDLPIINPIAYHTTVVTESQMIIVYGGRSRKSGDPLGDTILINVTESTVRRIDFSQGPQPCARSNHGSVYLGKRMFVYGGMSVCVEKYQDIWELIVETECKHFSNCGECLLSGGCVWCDPVGTPRCIAGKTEPYLASTCNSTFYTDKDPLICRIEHKASSVLIAVTVVILILIIFIVVATYYVDFKKGKSMNRGYEPI